MICYSFVDYYEEEKKTTKFETSYTTLGVHLIKGFIVRILRYIVFLLFTALQYYVIYLKEMYTLQYIFHILMYIHFCVLGISMNTLWFSYTQVKTVPFSQWKSD